MEADTQVKSDDDYLNLSESPKLKEDAERELSDVINRCLNDFSSTEDADEISCSSTQSNIFDENDEWETSGDQNRTKNLDDFLFQAKMIQFQLSRPIPERVEFLLAKRGWSSNCTFQTRGQGTAKLVRMVEPKLLFEPPEFQPVRILFCPFHGPK